jgi:hypothetical protein
LQVGEIHVQRDQGALLILAELMDVPIIGSRNSSAA